MHEETQEITDMILQAREKAYKETSNEPEPDLTKPLDWPIECTVGPGLEGAIACETKIGYVNGTKGWLIYRGHDIFDLCAYGTFEETAYLLVNGKLPNEQQLATFKKKMIEHRHLPNTLRMMMSFQVQSMNPMAALRIGTMMMRQRLTWRDLDSGAPNPTTAIAADEDSIPMETTPIGGKHAIYEFKTKKKERPDDAREITDDAQSAESCYHLIAGVSTICAAIARLRNDHLPIEQDPELGYAANLLYMMTGRKPTPIEERIMDVALILHADHGMNASTFASMVVASTLSDIYFSVGAGIAALNGPLHGGANEQVVRMLHKIGGRDNVKGWVDKKLKKKDKIMGFGHRVYKAYDPRARVLGPLAQFLARENKGAWELFQTATLLEKEVVGALGKKNIFPNVDFYSGLVYTCLGIPPELFTPIFAVSRTAGWAARILEYMRKNRIFRPRAMYTGSFDNAYTPLEDRGKKTGKS